jgi:hypothetical protein
MGTIIKVSNVTDTYKKVHEALYDLNPTIYHSGSFSWFKKTKKDLKKPYRVGKDGYIETNRNSQQKIETIKIVASLLELSPDDIRYSITNESELFKLDDESTYYNVPVGKMAFAMFKYILESGLISEEEVNNFKTKRIYKEGFQ